MTNFGAHWRWNWWRGRCGEDYLLETQAREHPADYIKVLRANWVGHALGESKVDGMTFGTGGLWNALALNLQLSDALITILNHQKLLQDS